MFCKYGVQKYVNCNKYWYVHMGENFIFVNCTSVIKNIIRQISKQCFKTWKLKHKI